MARPCLEKAANSCVGEAVGRLLGRLCGGGLFFIKALANGAEKNQRRAGFLQGVALAAAEKSRVGANYFRTVASDKNNIKTRSFLAELF